MLLSLINFLFFYLNKLINLAGFYIHVVFYYYFAYIYFFLGLSAVLHFTKISPSVFVTHFTVFPVLLGVLEFDVLPEFISEKRFPHRSLFELENLVFEVLNFKEMDNFNFLLFKCYFNFISLYL